MAGISSQSSGKMQNKKRYNGKSVQSQEFSDASGLEWTDYGARNYENQLGRWDIIDGKSEIYYTLSPYVYAGNNPVNAIDIDGNLFIFVNGFMENQYEDGLKHNFVERHNIRAHDNCPNPFNAYSPDRNFYRDGPKNNGESFTYWEGVDKAYENQYKDNNAYYTNGSFTPRSTADTRFNEGEKAGADLINKLDVGEITLASGETIKIVGHSQGAAYAAGIATALANSKYGGLIEFVDYISPHQPGDFKNPNKVVGRQFSTKSDLVSSKGVLAWLFGKSKYKKIDGSKWGKQRENYDGGYGGHFVGTWLNDLLNFWSKSGVNVNVIE